MRRRRGKRIRASADGRPLARHHPLERQPVPHRDVDGDANRRRAVRVDGAVGRELEQIVAEPIASQRRDLERLSQGGVWRRADQQDDERSQVARRAASRRTPMVVVRHDHIDDEQVSPTTLTGVERPCRPAALTMDIRQALPKSRPLAEMRAAAIAKLSEARVRRALPVDHARLVNSPSHCDHCAHEWGLFHWITARRLRTACR